MNRATCESCGVPVETGRYCQHCVDEDGVLQSFEERLLRMTDFILARDPRIDRREARSEALRHMRAMPAWRDRPEFEE